MNWGTRGSSRFITAAISFSMAAMLNACGGGGGGSTTTPPVITPPTGTLSVAPATCTVQAGLGKCTATATFATANATTAKLTNAGGTVLSTSLSGSQVVDVLIGANTYTLSANGGGAVATASATGACAAGTASSGSICVSPVTATLTASSPIVNGAKSTLTWGHTGDTPTGCTSSANWSNGGSLSGTGLSDTLTANATFTYSCTNTNGTTSATAVVTVCAVGDTVVSGVCIAPVVAAWWPPTFVQMGVKVYLNSATAPAGSVTNATYPGQTQSGLLPPACVVTGDDCWKEAVRNGTIQFVATNARTPQQPNRAVVFGSYKTVSTVLFPGQNKTMYCTKPYYVDDGSFASTFTNQGVENTCFSNDEVIYQVGNNLGEIFLATKIATGVNTCWQEKLDGAPGLVVPCP